MRRVLPRVQLIPHRVFEGGDLFLFDEHVRRRHHGEGGAQGQALAGDEVIRLDLFHRVAEKIDAHGVVFVDGEDVEDVSAQGEVALGVYARRAHIPHAHQPRGERGKVDLFPFLQFQNGNAAREQLHEAFDIAHGDAHPRLHARERRHAAEERVFGEGVFIQQYLVFGAEKGGLFARKAGDLRRHARGGLGVVGHIHDAPWQAGGGDEGAVRLGNAKNRRRRAEADSFGQGEIVAP